MALKQTPSQTVGPYFAYGLTPGQYGYPLSDLATGNLLDEDSEGTRIRLEGRIFDGAGAPVSDAMIEIWQADGQGRYAHSADGRGANVAFKGFGRFGTGTEADSRFIFETIKPGSVDGEQAPHINLIVFMRGILSHAYTRVYFADEAAANEADPVLALVEPARRATLIAGACEGGSVYRFDIHMQGENETVFFDV